MRLAELNFTPADIERFIEEHPPKDRLVPVSHPACICLLHGMVAVACCRIVAVMTPLRYTCSPHLRCMHAAPGLRSGLLSLPAHSPTRTLTHPQGVEDLIAALKARGVEVFLISGGFR